MEADARILIHRWKLMCVINYEYLFVSYEIVRKK